MSRKNREWWPYGRHRFVPEPDAPEICKACRYPRSSDLHDLPVKAKDVKPLAVAALLGLLLAWYEATKHSEPEPKNYDLMQYKPKPRRW